MLPARSYAVDRSGALINLTGDGNLLADVAPAVQRFMAALPAPPRQRQVGQGGGQGGGGGCPCRIGAPPQSLLRNMCLAQLGGVTVAALLPLVCRSGTACCRRSTRPSL